MSQKMTGLEAMRVARANRERQTVEPIVAAAERLQWELNYAHIKVTDLQRSVFILGQLIGTEIGKGLLSLMRDDIASLYEDLIPKALGSRTPVTVTVDPQHFRFMLEPTDKILAEIASKAMRSVQASGQLDHEGGEYVEINVPAITVRRELVERPRGVDQEFGAGGQDRTDASR